jgi:hypothetical protein
MPQSGPPPPLADADVATKPVKAAASKAAAIVKVRIFVSPSVCELPRD